MGVLVGLCHSVECKNAANPDARNLLAQIRLWIGMILQISSNSKYNNHPDIRVQDFANKVAGSGFPALNTLCKMVGVVIQ